MTPQASDLVERLDAIEASLSAQVDVLFDKGLRAEGLLVSQASASVGYLREQADTIAKLEADGARLREVLKPFAEVAAWAERNGHDLKDFGQFYT